MKKVIGLILGISVGIVAGCGSKDRDGKGGIGGGSGDKKSYTQRILDLNQTDLQELGIKAFPKGAKPLYPPGSSADFIQSTSLIWFNAQCWDVKNGPKGQVFDFGHPGDYYVWWRPYQDKPPAMPRKIWEEVYGPIRDVQTVTKQVGRKKDVSGNAEYWKIACSDETVILQGYCTDNALKYSVGLLNEGVAYKKNMVMVDFAYCSKPGAEYRPKSPEITRDVRFSYK